MFVCYFVMLLKLVNFKILLLFSLTIYIALIDFTCYWLMIITLTLVQKTK